jgi:hypothetical protein
MNIIVTRSKATLKGGAIKQLPQALFLYKVKKPNGKE